jgi:hypothetical protein
MNKKMLVALTSASFALFSFHKGHSSTFQQPDNELSAAEKAGGWTLLFDGKTTTSWRNYQNKPQDSWEVINGELHCKKDGVHLRADLVTKDNYASFEMHFDWKVSKGANSGLLYHVLETHAGSYETGPEYQLIDDYGYDGKLENWQKSGADYAMHPPTKIVSKPAGEYNRSVIVVKGAHVQHWLNGVKVADFTAWTPEWEKLKKEGKWKDYPDYGVAKSGLIALQDHDGGIWFKNIKIRKL